MKRTKGTSKGAPNVFQQVVTEILSRTGLARRMGFQYGDKRQVYKALGYPTEADLKFEYYYDKYDRQDIAKAIIDRPCDATWKGDLVIVEPDKDAQESELNKKWKELDELLSLKKRLNKVDKLCELGRFSLLLLGLDDVKASADFKRPVVGTSRKLLYVKQIAESEVTVEKWDDDTNSPRYGLPLLYTIHTGSVQANGHMTTSMVQSTKDITVHFSRVLHYVTGNLTSEVYGVPKLKPIINRLVDLEKILGGDAEMFWRGARPGYTVSTKDDYEMDDLAEEKLMTQLDKYEHDLRRVLVLKGLDVNALAPQVAEPLNHIDAQLQAISAQTGIPKRVLVGSERGELASSQDQDQWLSLIKTRQLEHAEPTILRPFINMLMNYGILPKVEDYNVMWEDVFAPSEKDKVDLGKIRSESLKAYSDSPLASEVLPPGLALKLLLGLNEEQVEEAEKAIEEQKSDEERLFNRIKQQEQEFAPEEPTEVKVKE